MHGNSKRGYFLFFAEVRKRVENENPESNYGELKKMVGLEWKKLSNDQKRQYEMRAQVIADEREKAELLTPTSKLLKPGQILVYCCKWQA